MDDIASRLAALPPQQRALLELRLLEKRRPPDTGGHGITRASGEGPFPLSSAQQRLWFLEQIHAGQALFNIPLATLLSGPLDVPALRRSLDAILLRHEALRTTFSTLEGTPVQTISPPGPVPLRIVDLTGVDESGRTDRVMQLLRDEARGPFDLSTDPMLRATLLQLAPNQHVLSLVVHHIATDGWSTAILSHEIGALYGAYSQGLPSPLPKLPIRYADFALWQRDRLQSIGEKVNYWRRQLENRRQEALELFGSSRRGSRSFGADTRSTTLPPALLQSLSDLAHGEKTTLFTALLAAYAILLHRYSGQDDLVIGSPVAGRNRPETEGLVGFFVNTLPLRLDLTGDPSFLELMGRARETMMAAFANQEVPFERIVEELHPERGDMVSPLFQAALVLHNAPRRSWSFPGLASIPIDVAPPAVQFDLTLSALETPAGLGISLQYKADLLDEAAGDRMLGHLRTLLEGAVAGPSRRLSQLPILTESERHGGLLAWNDTGRRAVPSPGIHRLFEQQAKLRPATPAITHGSMAISYGELNRRANVLAHRLLSLGVGRDSPVGVCSDRSIPMVVGMLAVLKAGGAYLPLDPSYPAERLELMLKDSSAPVVLATRETSRLLPETPSQTLFLDDGGETGHVQTEENLEKETASDDLAYVIYTSGSTGTPKGVAVPHRAISRLVVNPNYLEIDSTEVFAHLSSPSFDAATFEIWGALLNGARLAIIDRDEALDPASLAGRIHDEGITTMFLTTAWFNLLVSEQPRAFAGLRNLLFGGEGADPRSVRELLRNAPPQRLVHVYGPTECTTFATWHLVSSLAEDAESVPIGRPISSTRAYIVDKHLNPVPVGVAGELYLAGDGVARGYLNRPELTEERFLPDPFCDIPGQRMYRTGDLCRYLTGGCIDYLGRVDRQVKLRGFRVEPGEVEAVLLRHPSVGQAAVVVREDEEAGKRLVAYITDHGKLHPEPAEIRRFLQERLPEYMVPSSFVTVSELPLGPNGKVDRSLLPETEGDVRDQQAGFIAPRDEMEQDLAAMWEALLDVRPVGVTEDFFDLGGHSLLAVRLFGQIEQRFGRKLPLSTLLEGTTVERIAVLLKEEIPADAGGVLVPIRAGGTSAPLFCFHGVDGEIFSYRELARRLRSDHPIYGVQSHGLGEDRAGAPIEEMAERYVREIRCLQPHGPYLLAGYSAGGMWAFETARLLRAEGEEVALLALFDTLCPRLRSLSSATTTLAHIDRAIRRGLRSEPWAMKQIHWKAYVRYIPPSYPGRITLFRSTTRDEEQGHPPSRLGWEKVAKGGLKIREVSVAHLEMLSESHVRTLAEKLEDELGRIGV